VVESKTFRRQQMKRGQFSFETLIPPALYEAVAALPERGVPIKVDLTQTWCLRVVFLSFGSHKPIAKNRP